jgi:N-acetylglucosamine kinase-like BadF-type ATPase
MDHDILRSVVTEVFGEIPIQAYSESDIALACNGLTWGVSLVAGTGASCRAVNEKGEAHSCGGYGPQFGDEGSGYWIGREAVSAAMRARDGRNARTLLSDLICRTLEIGDIWEILRRAERSGHVAGPVIASLTPLVYDAARSGDAAALDICERAGSHLAELAAITATKLEFAAHEIPLALSGGVFAGNDLIMPSFAQTLSQHSPIQLRTCPPLTDVTEGIITCLLREPR